MPAFEDIARKMEGMIRSGWADFRVSRFGEDYVLEILGKRMPLASYRSLPSYARDRGGLFGGSLYLRIQNRGADACQVTAGERLEGRAGIFFTADAGRCLRYSDAMELLEDLEGSESFCDAYEIICRGLGKYFERRAKEIC